MLIPEERPKIGTTKGPIVLREIQRDFYAEPLPGNNAIDRSKNGQDLCATVRKSCSSCRLFVGTVRVSVGMWVCVSCGPQVLGSFPTFLVSSFLIYSNRTEVIDVPQGVGSFLSRECSRNSKENNLLAGCFLRLS